MQCCCWLGWLGLKETLPPERRIVGGFRRTLQGYNTLLHDRFFVGCALSSGLAGASMFAYIAGSTFVLQRIYGMSPQGFSLVFGCISLGLVAAAQGRSPPRPRLAAAAGTRLRLDHQSPRGDSAAHHGDQRAAAGRALIGALVIMVCAVGLIFPTANALAMADYPGPGRYRILPAGPQPVRVRRSRGTTRRYRRRADSAPARHRRYLSQPVCHDELCQPCAARRTVPRAESITLKALTSFLRIAPEKKLPARFHAQSL